MYTTGLRASLSKVRKKILSGGSSAAPGVRRTAACGHLLARRSVSAPGVWFQESLPSTLCTPTSAPSPPHPHPRCLGQSAQSSGAAGRQGQGSCFFRFSLGPRSLHSRRLGAAVSILPVSSHGRTRRPATGGVGARNVKATTARATTRKTPAETAALW